MEDQRQQEQLHRQQLVEEVQEHDLLEGNLLLNNLQEQQEQQPLPEQEHPVLEQQQRNRGAKSPKTEEQLAEEARREKEKKRQKALSKDASAVRTDKVRHVFYSAVKGVVNAWKSIFGLNKARNAVTENTRYMQSLQMAYDDMYALRLQAEQEAESGDEEALARFEQEHGEYFRTIAREYDDLKAEVRQRMLLEAGDEELNEEAYQRRLAEEMQQKQVTMAMGQQQRANVIGGTKPAAVQYGQDGSQWLVKEGVSCIGVNEPNGVIVTEVGYKMQKLVNPDTAIEAFRGQSIGKGIVSYQRMVKGVVNDVDLFRFSRTPESMTEEELARIQQLSPQLLREHTTDWLLYNFDTKGENFIVARDGVTRERVYGIDKEASFRAVLDEGAQKMDKNYAFFDQQPLYNRLFQKFADGSMELNLFDVQQQIERVEAMDDTAYMEMFADYLRQQQLQRPDKKDEIKEKILSRKQNLRMEYREFFTKLVNERCEALPQEAEALRQRYFGSADGGTFCFQGEGVEVRQQERLKKQQMREGNRDELDRKARQADKKDEKSYKYRHALYDFSKSIVMGVRKMASAFKRTAPDMTETTVSLSEIIQNQEHLERVDPAGYAQLMQHCQQRTAQLRAQVLTELALEGVELTEQQQTLVQERLQEKMAGEQVPINMERMHQVHLGGTKPMAEFYAQDGSRWLSKQAVNCMGYYKKEGVVLTEAGAKLQKIVHPATAVDAFVGRTRQLGDVSFQRRLENVEGGPNKLDLFKFSKHPEIATQETIHQVEEMGDQILREHTTDWLLCNFDTKGENFVVTIEEGRRVLHGIDKEAAFSKVLKPEAQVMSTTYKPHANNTLYNVVFSMYEKGEMDLDLFSVLPQIERVEQLGEEEYMHTYDDYLAYVEENTPEKLEKTREAIRQRMVNLREDYCNFFTQLVNNRCKLLHPDEAQALKDRYFGAGGARFRFPEPEQ